MGKLVPSVKTNQHTPLIILPGVIHFQCLGGFLLLQGTQHKPDRVILWAPLDDLRKMPMPVSELLGVSAAWRDPIWQVVLH